MLNDVPKILIVDDDPDILNLIGTSLRQKGYHTIPATTGEDAVELALQEKPDLVILDVRLPGMNGMVACRKIKDRGRSFVPVILVTVQGELAQKVSGLNHGADDYLTKPFVMEELHTRVRSMLRIKQLYDKQEKASVTDSLTGAYNRRYFQARLKEECERSLRYGKSFSCLMMDLDYFKKINDAYGHGFGDEVLRQFAAHVRGLIRRSDILIRFGGEEFVLLLPETTGLEARKMAELIRTLTALKNFLHSGRAVPVTCSIGVCTFPSPRIGDHEELLKCADDALYQAKKAGRNCVIVFSSNGSETPRSKIGNLD